SELVLLSIGPEPFHMIRAGRKKYEHSRVYLRCPTTAAPVLPGAAPPPGPEGVPAKPGEHLVSFELRGGVTAVSAQRGLTRGCAKTPASPGFMRLIQGAD